MTEEILVSKLDAARRQLETAVHLYFVEADIVATHTLACAAHEILETLHIRMGGKPTVLHRNNPDLRDSEKIRNEFHQLITQAKNFFKHANHDPDKTLQFKTRWTEGHLLEICQLYKQLTGEKTPLCKLFIVWMGIHHPEIFILDKDEAQTYEDIRSDPATQNRYDYYKAYYLNNPLTNDTLRTMKSTVLATRHGLPNGDLSRSVHNSIEPTKETK